MRIVIRSVAVTVASVLLTCGVAEARHIPSTKLISPQSFGVWSGGAYADDATGQFLYCAAWPVHPQADRVMAILFGRDKAWGLVFVSKNYNFLPDTQIPVKITIGPNILHLLTRNSESRQGMAVALDSQIIYLPMGAETTVLELFRHGDVISVWDGQIWVAYSLEGTSKLIGDLRGCVDGALAAENGTPIAPSQTHSDATEDDRRQKQASSGSGIIVSGFGEILTNAHVIDGCSTIHVRRGDDVEKQASIIAKDDSNDLALLSSELRLDYAEAATFRIGAVRAGEDIAAYGFPLAGVLSSTGNIVSGNITALSGVADDVRYFQISAPVQPGNSGGPLLDYSGLVVGIVNAKLNALAFAKATGDLPQNVNFAIKEDVVAAFLDANSIPYNSSSPVARLDLPEITERAQQFTVFIRCEP